MNAKGVPGVSGGRRELQRRLQTSSGGGGGEGEGGERECRRAAIANFDSYISSIYPRYISRGLPRDKVRNRLTPAKRLPEVAPYLQRERERQREHRVFTYIRARACEYAFTR